MKIKLKRKAEDAMVRVGSMSEEERNLIWKFNDKLTYVSFSYIHNSSPVIESMKGNKGLFMGDDVREAFRQEPEEVFQYLSTLNDKDLWIEINRHKRNITDEETARRYQLGIRAFEFHHASIVPGYRSKVHKLPKEDTIFIFHYDSIDKLIADIREEMKSR